MPPALSLEPVQREYPVAAIVDGEYYGLNWTVEYGWADGTLDAYPDWLEVA